METTLFYARAACDTMMRKFVTPICRRKAISIITRAFFFPGC